MTRTDHLKHLPDDQGLSKIERIRFGAIQFEALLDEIVPASRELSLAKTNLEQARMWAVKGVTMQYPVEEIPDSQSAAYFVIQDED